MPENRDIPQDIALSNQPPKVVEDSSVDSSVLPTPDKQTNTQELHELSFETWVTVEIPKQYEEQIEVYNKLGLLQLLIEKESGDMGIVGIDGKEYPIPTLESIQSELRTNREKYETKQKQGFVKLQMTPFALPLERLTMLLEERLFDHDREEKLLGSDMYDPPRQYDINKALNRGKPQYIADWINPKRPDGEHGSDVVGNCIYHVTSFDKDSHGGFTKQQILNTQTQSNFPFAGWEVKLLEATIIIPRVGKGKKVRDRKQLEANKSPKEYLQQLQTDSTYRNEQGLTNEDWLILFLTHLEQTNHVIDEQEGLGADCFLLGSFNKNFSGSISYAYWDRFNCNVHISSRRPDERSEEYGIRTAVPVGN